MNDTPETDRQWAEWLNKLKMPIESFVDFARRLERERDEARAERDEWIARFRADEQLIKEAMEKHE